MAATVARLLHPQEVQGVCARMLPRHLLASPSAGPSGPATVCWLPSSPGGTLGTWRNPWKPLCPCTWRRCTYLTARSAVRLSSCSAQQRAAHGTFPHAVCRCTWRPLPCAQHTALDWAVGDGLNLRRDGCVGLQARHGAGMQSAAASVLRRAMLCLGVQVHNSSADAAVLETRW